MWRKQVVACLSLLIALEAASAYEVYNITKTWNSLTIDPPNNPIQITLDRHDDESFKIVVNGRFYDDPAPPGPSGQAFYGLWDYEVAEVFFLNDNNQYVEIELGPHGHHLILLLDGQRNTVRHSLPVNNITNSTGNGKWHVEAFVPIEYLPPNVTKMNAYAIHGTGDDRVYEALYPVVYGTPAPDFHNLCAFKSFNPSIITSTNVTEFSSIWLDSLKGSRTLKISKTWANQKLPSNETALLKLSIMNNTSLKVNVDAPFYNDPAPNTSLPAGPLETLKDKEVIHLFLLSETGEYLELQFGPWDHYLVAFWSKYKESAGNHSLKINYSVTREDPRWYATAVIPLSYLPPNVTKCNAHLAHGPGDKRQVSSLYPAGAGIAYDFHDPKYYRAIDFEMLYKETQNLKCSPLWYDIYPECGSNAVVTRPLVGVALLSMLLTYIFQAQ